MAEQLTPRQADILNALNLDPGLNINGLLVVLRLPDTEFGGVSQDLRFLLQKKRIKIKTDSGQALVHPKKGKNR